MADYMCCCGGAGRKAGGPVIGMAITATARAGRYLPSAAVSALDSTIGLTYRACCYQQEQMMRTSPSVCAGGCSWCQQADNGADCVLQSSAIG